MHALIKAITSQACARIKAALAPEQGGRAVSTQGCSALATGLESGPKVLEGAAS